MIDRRPSVRVRSRAGLVAVSAAGLAAVLAGPASAQLQPAIGPAVRVDAGGPAAANETTASSTPSNPDEIVIGWNDWRDSGSSELIRAGFSWSLDGGATWTEREGLTNLDSASRWSFPPRTDKLGVHFLQSITDMMRNH